MEILLLGLNYKTAPVEIREKFTFNDDSTPRALHILSHTKSILECIIVGTCNRTEIYVVCDQLHTGRFYTRNFLAEWFGVEKESLLDYMYVKENDEAIEHLYRVTCGLDSMVMGETQIIGQIRNAFLLAQQHETTGTIFNTLFKQAVTLAKRAHTETSVGQNAVSISYAAIELGKKIFGSFADKHVLILGAGKMSLLTAKHLHANGVAHVTVANRTLERAQTLAEQFRGEACTMEDLPQKLAKADIVISSTGATGFVLTKAQLKPIMKQRPHKPLFMIDIAVPRDLDPDIHGLENVFLYDIDDLEGIVQSNLAERSKEAERIELMIEEEKQEFINWKQTLGVVPLIAALREKAFSIHGEAIRKIENKLPHLNEKEMHIIRKHTRGIISQLLHDPIVQLKELTVQKKGEEVIDIFSTIFALDERLEGKKQEALWEQQKRESLRREKAVSLQSREQRF
ncbi:glutamyl-tRNA reductase [Brevibacillus laterosporus]|uniref:glutamyl-tRNA reductase n=1 Tax=Brevibacillus TaxID=55080 RepID=UPI000C787F5F|nr:MULTISPECIES: glutamyl-tRNA reductase [Brevibacillus]AUM64119.1 glutamyl-tRNA reductase [Brevibacillus laterosporus]MCR8962072.1 glutamyl-tRNA reductase [Brevibacillus laterosporus]MCZ0834227.1 glutamyl-tRNA reductase [Brevibacillus halotolerans]MDF9411195.1 glutamyl-tRNA reductase [Brevibacillus laterosporus]